MSIALREVFVVPEEHDVIMHNIMQYCILNENRKPKSSIKYTCAKITIIRHLVAMFRDYLESNSDVTTITVFCDDVTTRDVLYILNSISNNQYNTSPSLIMNYRMNKLIRFFNIGCMESHHVSKRTNVIVKPSGDDIVFENTVLQEFQKCDNLIYINTEIGSGIGTDPIISSKTFNFEHNFIIPRLVMY